MKTEINNKIIILLAIAVTMTIQAAVAKLPAATNHGDGQQAVNNQFPPFIPLWPEGQMPNSKGLDVKDEVENERFQQVALPGIYTLFPSKDDSSGCAVLIIPGGGYRHETFNLAGLQFGKWFNTLGISAFVLKYRLPHSPDLKNRQEGPLQDAQRAMQLIRAHAEQWGIDKNKIGVMGSSAGGHLAALLGTSVEDITSVDDPISRESFAPNFMILISPVISMGPYTHRGSRDNLLGPDPSNDLIDEYSADTRVTEKTPPSFLVHAADDTSVPPLNSLLFTQALLRHGISTSLHLFPSSGHSIGLSNNPPTADLWTELCERWMKEKDYIQ